MLVDGQWQENWQPVQSKDADGRFIRQTSTFRHWITADGSAGPTGNEGFKAEAGRYHLYVAYICPWASRTLMVRALKGLEDYISVSVVNPKLSDQGWQFGGYEDADTDPLHHISYLHELYTMADPKVYGRATVPVLWDKHTNTLVNNESADIIRMLNSAFDHLTGNNVNLYPTVLQNEIDALNTNIYTQLNNGVYQAGFASSQKAYEEAYQHVFAMLNALELRLSDGRQFLFGDTLTESDIRLFVTLIRFDAAYYSLFKCNQQQIKAMPFLHGYMHRIYDIPGIANTVNIDHIKAGYYSINALNPTGIIPIGPAEI